MDLRTVLMHLQCELVAQRNLVNPNNISWLQYDILLQLSKDKQILPSKLSDTLGISRTKLSKALKGLKVSGHIQQLPNQDDGRELFTSISPSGKKLLSDISNQHADLYSSAVNAMNKEEQAEFCRLAAKLSKALKQARINDSKQSNLDF